MNAHDEPSALDATVNDVSLTTDEMHPRAARNGLVKTVAVLVARADKAHARLLEKRPPQVRARSLPCSPRMLVARIVAIRQNIAGILLRIRVE